MARRDRLVPGGDARCGCDCGDCGGAPPIPLALRPARRRWIPVLQLLVALAVAFIAGTLGCALTDWWSADAQQIVIDTSTAQYKKAPTWIDSIAVGPLAKWALKLKLTGWKILLKADSLETATAQTYVSEPYRNALIIVDLRRLHSQDIDEVILHELWHVRLALYTAFVTMLLHTHDGAGVGGPLLEQAQRNEEALVSDITRAMLWR